MTVTGVIYTEDLVNVYEVKNHENDKVYACKYKYIGQTILIKSKIKHEYKCLKVLKDYKHSPNAETFNSILTVDKEKYSILVMDLLGPNLYTLKHTLFDIEICCIIG